MFATFQEIPLSDEDFKLFHSIDRELYRKLFIDLRRDAAESMSVMAFWMWLEQQCTGGLTTVKKMLSLPLPLIDQLANESLLCLKCAETSLSSSIFLRHEMAAAVAAGAFELKYLPKLLGKNVTMAFFYNHGISVLQGVARLSSQVCSRAFQDMLLDHNSIPRRPTVSPPLISFGGVLPYRDGATTTPMISSSVVAAAARTAPPPMAMFNNNMRRAPLPPPPMADHIDHQRLSTLPIGNNQNNLGKKEVVEPEDRTIFLTFSKGYPLSEAEVMNFFTRLYGDFIEEIHMQKVIEGEQPLYARLICRKASVMDTVVHGGRAMYNIDGKHVYVRKFVKRKNNPKHNKQFAPSSSHSYSSSATAAMASSSSSVPRSFANYRYF